MSVFREGQLPLRAASKSYVDDAVANASVGGATQNSFLVSGGQIVWTADYDFLVAPATYYIDGVLYSSPQSPITLDASDPTNDRIDVIAVDNTGTVVKVTGTAAAQPSEPDIDPGTQLKLGIVFVAAASTEPTVNNELIYFENAGGPTEWNWTEVGTTFDPNSTNDPKAPATKSIEGTSATAGDYAQGDIPSSSYDPSGARLLTLYIKSKATWQNNRGLSISLRTGGVLQGQVVNINRTGSFGFSSANTTDWQLIAIPITQFAIPVGQTFTQIRITAFGNGHGFFIADINIQEEGVTQLPTGITLEQAEALFVSKSATLLTSTDQTSDLPNSRHLIAGTNVTFDDTVAGDRTINVGIKRIIALIMGNGTNVISTGVQGFLSCPVAGTITRVRVLSIDAAVTSGDIVIDIWKDTYANYPPTVADTITASAKPTISGGIKAEDTTLTGWTTAVAAGDVFAFNVDSVTDLKRVIIELTIQE